MTDYRQDADFCLIYPHVLNVEGGYVDDPNDPGGPTNWGIAYNFNKSALHQLGITSGTMKQLTKENAIQIYYWKYWLAADCQYLHDRDLQLIHFDAAVNHGVGAAKEILRSLKPDPKNYIGDGQNKAMFTDFFLDYLVMRLKRYARDKNRGRYLTGWVNRLTRIYDVAENDRGFNT